MLPLVSIMLLVAGEPNPSAQPALLEGGFRQMYDLQFEEAHRTFRQWMEQHPEDPLGPACDAAAYLFTELDRLKILQSEFFLHDDAFVNRSRPAADPKLKQNFETALEQTRVLSERALAKNPGDVNAQFASLMRFGTRSDYLALVEKRYLASLADVKQSRMFAEKLIAENPNLADAYMAVGIENYLLSLKPAALRWFLRMDGAQTDKQRGIQDIAITAQRGHFFQPFARILLAVAALRDKNVSTAKQLLSELAREFPRNVLFTQELARLH